MTTRKIKEDAKAKKKVEYYVAPDENGVPGKGKRYLLVEALHDFPIRIYKKDKNKAVPGDPHSCLIALGAKRMDNVIDAFVGAGKDAYVVFSGPLGDYAIHFTIPAATRRIVDNFDKSKKAISAIITFRMPTAGRTRAARKVLNAKRQAEIKAGTGKPKKPRAAAVTRVQRLGLAYRPRPEIVTDLVETLI